QAQAENLVRKDAEAKAKREQSVFDGLPEGLTLGRKMGDGAFSNVFEATYRPTPAQLAVDPKLAKEVKVAVKCVRKFELNSSQVRTPVFSPRHHCSRVIAPSTLLHKVSQAQGKHVGEAVKKKPRATERANILKEVQIMRGLNHPGIVRLLNFTESSNHYYLTLELMEGGELFHQIVKLTYFSEELSRHVILQVAHAIRYLHEEKGVVHRDIKPENILFEGIPIIPSKVPRARPYDEEKEDEGEFIPGIGGGGIGRVKIADFGLSKIVWNEETMTPCGTVGYTAPEIVKDERYSKSVDMWALGCVLYTLLCGFPPFYDESIHVLTEKVAKGYYTFLSPWWDDISASSKDLITHLLDVDPEKRYTIDEFLAHPWCKAKPAPSAVTPGTLDSLKLKPVPKYTPLDSPMLAPGGRRAMPSPGIATLKEAFDVTYAVHRMEEEGKQRQRAYNGPGGAGRAGFLQGLNEADEEEEEDLEATKRRYGAEVSRAIEEQRRLAQDPSRRKAPQTAEEQARAAREYAGWGGADRRQAEAALYHDHGRAGPRDRGRKQRGIDLSLDAASILSRRKKPMSPTTPQ
ncbi:Pkinase-domain-containing protein, partial [Rhodotorula sp. JG-1b]